MYKKQKGVALVVAMMVTIIMGIIAVSMAGVAFRGQRAQNAHFGNSVSDANAISGINRVINFLETVAADSSKNSAYLAYDGSLYGVNIGITNNPGESFTFSGQSIAIKDLKTVMFGGVDNQLDVSNPALFNYKSGALWYRTASNWTGSNCTKCVKLNDGLSIVRMEDRGFVSSNPGVSSSTSNIGYRFLRLTSRGVDSVDDPSQAESIYQVNVGVLSSK